MLRYLMIFIGGVLIAYSQDTDFIHQTALCIGVVIVAAFITWWPSDTTNDKEGDNG